MIQKGDHGQYNYTLIIPGQLSLLKLIFDIVSEIESSKVWNV